MHECSCRDHGNTVQHDWEFYLRYLHIFTADASATDKIWVGKGKQQDQIWVKSGSCNYNSTFSWTWVSAHSKYARHWIYDSNKYISAKSTLPTFSSWIVFCAILDGEGESEAIARLPVWFVVQKTRSASTERGKMRYVLETVTSAKAGAELRSPAVEAQHPCLHAALWRGSIFLPFMSPDKQQQPRCLDQWLVNFHTRLKELQQCSKSRTLCVFLNLWNQRERILAFLISIIRILILTLEACTDPHWWKKQPATHN